MYHGMYVYGTREYHGTRVRDHAQASVHVYQVHVYMMAMLIEELRREQQHIYGGLRERRHVTEA